MHDFDICQVFGVAPPQTLYHTRHTPSSSLVNVSTYSVFSPPKSSDAFSSGVGPSKHHPSRVRARKPSRQPSIAESSLDLLDKSQEFDSYGFDARHTATPTPDATAHEQRHSNIYNHYQQSLNSLNDMMDRVRVLCYLLFLEDPADCTRISTRTIRNPFKNSTNT